MSRPDSEPVGQVLNGLRAASRNLVEVNNHIGHYTEASIPLFKGGWSTYVDANVVQRVLAHETSMAELFQQPQFEEYLARDSTHNTAAVNLLQALLVPGTQAVLEEPFFRLRKLRDLQDLHGDNDRHLLAPIFRRRYNYMGGSKHFSGVVRWGMIDDEIINSHWISDGVQLSVRLATRLPHVRYQFVFEAFDNGMGAELRQHLVIDPRVAMIPLKWEPWYESVRGKLPTKSELTEKQL